MAAPTSSCSISKASADPTASAPSPTRRPRAGKPLIVAKVGRSDAGRRAAASHTGALAHAGAVDDAIFRHHGIIRGEDLDHMVDVATAFAFCPLPRGNRVAVITGSGGSAVWMADILSAHGLELPVLEDDIQRRSHGAAAVLRLGAEPDRRDRAGDRRGRLCAGSSRSCAQSRADRHDPPDRLARQRSDRAQKRAEELAAIDRRRATSRSCLSTYTTASPAGDGRLRRGRHPLLHLDAELRPRDPGAGRLRPRSRRGCAPRRRRPRPRRRSRDEVAPRARRRRPGADRDTKPRRCSPRYGVPRPPEELATSADEAVAAAARIGGAVALKVQSPDITHKTEAGAVRARPHRRGGGARGLCAGAGATREAAHPGAAIDGVLVQAMARPGHRDDPRRHAATPISARC